MLIDVFPARALRSHEMSPFCLLIFVSSVLVAGAKLLYYSDLQGKPYNVTYDSRAILINEQRTMLLSGSIHYVRSTPAMWEDIMTKAKQEGLNCIQTYAFWNFHERNKGEHNFSGRGNVSLFLETAAKVGLFVNFRIGPFVCAEWDYGGLPVWLNKEEGMEFRSYNAPWMTAMKAFVDAVVKEIRPFLARNGGPIILAQIENEYPAKSDLDWKYVDWCGQLAQSYDLCIPWVMCSGASANNTINTCNGNNCWDYAMEHNNSFPGQPLMWTENEGWFEVWPGDFNHDRSAEDVAFSVAEWIAAGGTYHNYYMWHGGNNYGLWACNGVTTMYANDVMLHSDSTIHEPKYSHLGSLHAIVGEYADLIVSNAVKLQRLPIWDPKQNSFVAGRDQWVSSFGSSTGINVTFLINIFKKKVAVLFQGRNTSLQGESVIVLDKNGQHIYDTSRVNVVAAKKLDNGMQKFVSDFHWQVWGEPVGNELRPNWMNFVHSRAPIEQLSLTHDQTAYLLYRTHITQRLTNSSHIVIESENSVAFLVFLDGHYVGNWTNAEHVPSKPMTADIPVWVSEHTPGELLEIMAISFGLACDGIRKERFERKGIIGHVLLDKQDITDSGWEHQIGLVGEYLSVFTLSGRTLVEWNDDVKSALGSPLKWFRTSFVTPSCSSSYPIVLNATGLNRGYAYVNGHNIGRYWPTSGVQILYHIPPDWLIKGNGRNELTVFEEVGAINMKSVSVICKQ